MIRRHHTLIDEPLDPQIAAELEELERALAGAPNADPVLSALVRDVRADAPVFDGPAREALDARVAAGFGAGGEGAPAPRAAWLSRFSPSGALFRPALGVAATALLGIAIATATLTGDDGTTTLRDGDRSVAALPQEAAAQEDSAGTGTAVTNGLAAGGTVGEEAATPQVRRESASPVAKSVAPTSTAADSATPFIAGTAAPSPSDPGRLGGTRRVERSAELTLSTAPDEVQSVADDVVSTVQALGGVVASSRIATSDDGGEAFFDLRLPTARLDRGLSQLSKLAHVAGLSQNSDDITGAFVSTADRLKDARDERAALLKALGRATTDRQISSIKARLADSRRRIASIEAELRGLRARTDRATVALTIRGDGTPRSGEDDGGGAWTPGDAARDALRVLEVAAGVAVIAAAALVPLGLLGLLGLLTARTTRRRGRERALDAA